MPSKLSYSYIKNYIELYEKHLHSKKYKNSRTKLKIECMNNHIYYKTWNNFQSGQRCPICSKLKDKWKSQRYGYEYVKNYFKKYGFILKSKNYINSKTKLKVECKNGHIINITFNTFKQRHKCGECCREKNKKENHPAWKGGVFKKNIPLYNTYAHQIDWAEKVKRDPNNKNYLQVKCTNSNCRKWFMPKYTEVVSRINALNGKINGAYRFYCSEECKQSCSIYRQKKYPKGFIPENYNRSSQKEWADMVKKRDNYICQKCGKKGIIAHHIEGLNVNPIMSADIDSGITLCKECDKKIHSEIGCRYIDLQKTNLCKGLI